jgi:glycosyltransferase involved in cell wall biosynthesis/SAM-dependent methyltransferase
VSQYSHLTADRSNENSAVTKIARVIGHDRTVLDVGCAHGYLAEMLRAQGCRVVGIERDAGDAARARTHCEQVFERDVEQPGWADGLGERRFDAIVFADVLEHLRDPAAVVRRALPLLAPDGFIVASIPNVAHVSVRLELLLGSFRREKLGILDQTHLQFFTRDSLDELLASCGVAVESWDITTNEIAESVVADYLRRAGVAYTPELRDLFAQPEAAAFQFVVKGRPAAGRPVSVPAALEKPLQVMENLVRELEQIRGVPGRVAPAGEGALRVLQVVHQFLPRHAGGTEIYCSDLSFGLARRGHAVRVLTGAFFREDLGTRVHRERDTTIVVEGVPAKRAYRWFGAAAGFFDRFDNPDARSTMRDVIERTRPHVVHVQHLLHLSADVIRECRARGIPVVVTLHDYWFFCHRVKLKRRDGALCEGPARGWNCAVCLGGSPLLRSRLNPVSVAFNLYRYAYLKRLLLMADRILSPSRFLRDRYGRNGVDPERITVCDLGTDGPPPELRARRRHDPLRFGFLGALIRDKGLHVLIDAFETLPPGAAELHVFGFPAEPEYADELRRRARHPGVRWRGAIPHAERWRALAEIDVLVVPSIWYENSPLSIHEARAVGVPVIGSAIGGIPEFIRDGTNGLTFPAGDATALAARLRQVTADPACVSRWERAIVVPKTMQAHVEEIEAIYRELCAGRSTRDDAAAARP